MISRYRFGSAQSQSVFAPHPSRAAPPRPTTKRHVERAAVYMPGDTRLCMIVGSMGKEDRVDKGRRRNNNAHCIPSPSQSGEQQRDNHENGIRFGASHSPFRARK